MKIGSKRTLLSIFHKSKKGKYLAPLSMQNIHDLTIFQRTIFHEYLQIHRMQLSPDKTIDSRWLFRNENAFTLRKNAFFFRCKATLNFTMHVNPKVSGLVSNPTFRGKSWKRILYSTRLKSDSNGRVKSFTLLL